MLRVSHNKLALCHREPCKQRHLPIAKTTMRTSTKASILLSALLLCSFPRQTFAHSHLANPLPTRKLHCRVGGDQRQCFGPCPINDDYGRLNPVNKNQPAEVWGRGATVNVRWHRDNHDGTGFVRLTLVPIDSMHDKGAHDKFAFQFLCMNEGAHKCHDRSYDFCGNDFEGMAWQAQVQVPTSYPDGVYVFGWSWYGGGNYLDNSFFGDYYSCSYVEIRGGLPVTTQYEPVYNGETCRSSTDRLGVCWKEPCHIGPMQDLIPMEFNNRKPAPIQSSWIPENYHEQHGGPGTSATTSDDNNVLVQASESTSFTTGSSDAGESSPFTMSSSSSGSVTLGARSGGEVPREGTEEQSSGGGSLGVFFLDFQDWSKKEIKDGSFYRTNDYPRGFTVEAFYNGAVRDIEFFVDGNLLRKETRGPFVMNGNHGKVIHGWAVPTGRTVALKVVANSNTGTSESFAANFQFD